MLASTRPREGLLDGGGEHVGFEAGLLLIEDQDGLGEVGIAQSQFFLQVGDLGVLATEAEDGGAGDVGVVDVAGDETAEGAGVVAGSAAAELMD